jgi:FAD synthase
VYCVDLKPRLIVPAYIRAIAWELKKKHPNSDDRLSFINDLAEGLVDGVASVGTRPTFDLKKPLLEVHLFDFDRDIYGEYIHVDFIGHIRDEEKYDSIDELVAQMNKDVENAKAILAAIAA